MIVVDISEDKKVVEALEKRVGKDNYKIEQIGTFDCIDSLFPISDGVCFKEEELAKLDNPRYDKSLCEECPRRKYVRFADFTNDTRSFFYERKTVFDFISSRKRRLYDQFNRIDTFIENNKGLILEGMSDYIMIYDAYWKNIDKKALRQLSPIAQTIFLAGNPEWTWSFIRELKMRNMEFVQTWNLDETIRFIEQCDKGVDKTPKLRLIPKRYPDVSIERNILALFDGIGKVRSEKILKEEKQIKKILKILVNKVQDLGYGLYNDKTTQ